MEQHGNYTVVFQDWLLKLNVPLSRIPTSRTLGFSNLRIIRTSFRYPNSVVLPPISLTFRDVDPNFLYLRKTLGVATSRQIKREEKSLPFSPRQLLGE